MESHIVVANSNSENIRNLQNLKDKTFRSSEYVRSQIQGIDTNLLIGSLFTLIVSFSLSVFFKILVYWIPSSFLLMLSWSIYGYISQWKRGVRQNSEKSIKTVKQPNHKQIIFSQVTLFRNALPFVNAIAVVFAVSFGAIVFMFSSNLIPDENNFPKTVPLISIICIFIFLLYAYRGMSILEKEQFDLTDMAQAIRTRVGTLGCFKGCMSCLFTIIFAIMSLVVLPVWSLIVIHPLYTSGISGVTFLLLVTVLQMLTISFFASYFSSISLKKELLNALTNLSIIDNMISSYTIKNENISEEQVNELIRLYYQAKRYEFAVVDTLKIINFYFLIPSKVYFDKLED